MSKTYSAASIYGIIDRMDAKAIQDWLGWHKRLKYPSRFINLFTAAKFEQGPDVLRQVKTALPDTTPIWRGYDGKDAWGQPNTSSMAWDDSNFFAHLANTSAASAAMLWFNHRVKPYLRVIREAGAIVHLLNEADPVFNAPFETECIRILGEEGIRAGAFAWAAGTPDWNDYHTDAISAEVAMAAKYKALVMCHEYAGLKPEQQNSLINRNATLTKLFPTPPDVFLGEFALCKADVVNGRIVLDADGGWREVGATEVQYFDFIHVTANLWYLPNKVSFSLFDWAGWGRAGSFGVSKYQGLLDELAEADYLSFTVEDTPMETPAAPMVVTRPAEAQIGIRMRVRSIPTEYRNLRDTWSYLGKITGALHPDDVVRRFDIPLRSGPVSEFSFGNWLYVEKLSSDQADAAVIESGYVWNNRIQWDTLKSATQETPVAPPASADPAPTELPPPPQETWPEPPAPPAVPAPTTVKRPYSFTIEATDEQHAAIEKALMTLLLGVVSLGQSITGAKVTLNP